MPSSEPRVFPVSVVLRNYDGDTVDVVIDMGFDISLKIRVRLFGVDTPELRGGTLLSRALALKAREFVHKWLTIKAYRGDGLELVSYESHGKYGRCLGDFRSRGHLLTEELIEKKFAVKYDGESARDESKFIPLIEHHKRAGTLDMMEVIE